MHRCDIRSCSWPTGVSIAGLAGCELAFVLSRPRPEARCTKQRAFHDYAELWSDAHAAWKDVRKTGTQS